MAKSKRGAPAGNQNARRGTEWRTALSWALENYSGRGVKRGQALRKIALKVVDRAVKGDREAWAEIGCRLDGKPAQAFEIGGLDGGPIETRDVSEITDIEAARRICYVLESAVRAQQKPAPGARGNHG